MTILTADAVGGRHTYLAANRPRFRRSMDSIVNEGGPWPCPSCDAASLLVYRCSVCGRDLASTGATAGQEQ